MPDLGPLPPLNQLRVFEAAARLLSFTEAGRELHLTQSAVSQQVKALEVYVGRPLFVRHSRSIDLTESGRAYLPVVQRALDALATGTQSVFGGRDERHLTIQVSLSFGLHWLTPRLPEFLAMHPDVTLNVVTTLHEPERTAAAADVEVRMAETLTGATLLRRNRYFPVCAPHLVATADWRTDTLFDCAAMHRGWRTWLAEQGEILAPGQRVHLASTYALGLEAAERGAALAMALDTIVDSALAAGRLARPFDHVAEAPHPPTASPPAPSTSPPPMFRCWGM